MFDFNKSVILYFTIVTLLHYILYSIKKYFKQIKPPDRLPTRIGTSSLIENSTGTKNKL